MNLQPEILENHLLRIIPLGERDFTRLFSVASDPLIWEQHPIKDRYQKEVFQHFFNDAVVSGSAFLIFEKTSNELIGSTRFYDYKPELSSVAIGYTFLARKYWGGNYNMSIKKLLLDYAFQFVNSVKFHIGTTNIRSQKAILKIGAKKINEIDLDYHDRKVLHYEYEIKKNEWNS